MSQGPTTPETLKQRGDGPGSGAGDPEGSAARVLDEREAIAAGEGAEQPGTGEDAGQQGVADESGYSTEVEQGAAQRP